MFRIAIGFALVVVLASCATAPMISAPALTDLAPTGKLRVGIMYTQLMEKHGISGASVSPGAPVR